MARIRTVKPEFWTSEQVMECSPLARLLFIGLWNFCDDAGNHPASAKTLKALVFPGDDIAATDVQRLLDELSTNRLLAYYEHAGKRYLHVRGWNHQKIDRPTIKHPDYPGDSASDDESPSEEPELFGADAEEIVPKEPAGEKADPLQGFAEFWGAYPNKKGKQAAAKAWVKAKVTDDLFALIAGGLAKHCASREWLKDGGEFIPHPATWLNGKRWEDEVKPAGNVHAFPRKQANGPDFHSDDTSWANDLGDL
jgi:hypothetical protein